MYIRYFGNIHNTNNYYSLFKGGTRNNCIQLAKQDAIYSLEFKDTETRDFILNEIWLELEKGTTNFDIDVMIETYNVATRYNL